MLNQEKIDLLSSYAKNQTIQIVVGAILLSVFSFVVGRSSVEDCDKAIICKDIKQDRDTLSLQLTNSRTSCLKEKEALSKKLKQDFDIEMARLLKGVVKSCEFSEDVHCPICIARKVCTK